MSNKIVFVRPKLRDLLKIKTDADFHAFLICQAINDYKKFNGLNKRDLGSILALGTNHNEVRDLPKFNFNEIIISNLSEPDDETLSMYKKNGKDPRIKFAKEDLEKINRKSRSHDVVFCKESLHHIPRPYSGLYEMLRVCKKAAIFIEPHSSFFGRIFEKLKISSKHEGNPRINVKLRKDFHDGCYVYRWSARDLEKTLNSYYLESGYTLYIINFWLSSRMQQNVSSFNRKMLITLGWIASFIPFNRGNFIIAIIIPGKSNPHEKK